MDGEDGTHTITPVGTQDEIQLGTAGVFGRRRRPSGEKPPLPRTLRPSGWLWLFLGLTVLLGWLSLFLWPDTQRAWYDIEHRVTFLLVDIRNDSATAIMKGLDAVSSGWVILALRWGTILVLVIFRRWRHLLTFVVAITLLEFSVNLINQATIRERPLAVDIIGSWSGSSHPSRAIASLAITLVSMRYALLPRGRWRTRWWAIGGLVALVAVARLYLALDHPSDVIFGFLLAIAVGVVTFRLMAPSAVFPVRYDVGPAAHLDLDEERRASITRAVREQLGFEVTSVEPFALQSSAGSTPLRLKVRGAADVRYLFAKLYASNHLRADRWYKLARTILYGYLEDEVRFELVSRLVEHEDYMLRVMRDGALPTPRPFGVVEMIPEREYLIVMEFIEGSQELDQIDLSDEVIDRALRIVHGLWEARLAHRDIKPGNVLVAEGDVTLIDVAFATARPTPWREAVDLANMMLVLAMQADPRRVYQRAQLQFTPGDIAEAFAATRSVTMPSQLRAHLRDYEQRHGVDLVEAFRRLAPPAAPISVQRWSLRRIALTAGVLFSLAVLAWLVVYNLQGAGFL